MSRSRPLLGVLGCHGLVRFEMRELYEFNGFRKGASATTHRSPPPLPEIPTHADPTQHLTQDPPYKWPTGPNLNFKLWHRALQRTLPAMALPDARVLKRHP